MQSVSKKRKREPATSKPKRPLSDRKKDLAEFIISLKIKAIVSYSYYINYNVEC